MSEPSFTPGPWQSDGKIRDWHGGALPACRVYFQRGEMSHALAMCLSQSAGVDSAIANAALTAAAPDLYAVLADAVAKNAHTENPDWWGRVFAALAKARGEQP